MTSRTGRQPRIAVYRLLFGQAPTEAGEAVMRPKHQRQTRLPKNLVAG